MSSGSRPILPNSTIRDPVTGATSSSSSSPHPSAGGGGDTARSKRHQISAACESCRRRKSKCDGQRPSCSTCLRRGEGCVFTLEPDETRSTALKRRYEDLEEKLDEMTLLYSFLRVRSEREAVEILRRIRSTPDPSVVVQSVKDGDLLIQQQRGASRGGKEPVTATATGAEAETLRVDDGLIETILEFGVGDRWKQLSPLLQQLRQDHVAARQVAPVALIASSASNMPAVAPDQLPSASRALPEHRKVVDNKRKPTDLRNILGDDESTS